MLHGSKKAETSTEGRAGGHFEDPKLGRIASAEISRYPDHPAPGTEEETTLGQMEQRKRTG